MNLPELKTHFPRLHRLQQRIWDHPIHWRSMLLRVGLGAAALAVVIFLGALWGEHIPAVEAFIREIGIWGPIVFIVLFVVTMPFFVPNAGFAMAAGALFGLWWGTVYIVLAGLIAEMILFTAGHHFLRAPVERWLQKYPKLLAIRGALIKQPVKLMILLRLSPLPFTPICYMMSTTRVTYRQYLIGFLGYIPGNFVTVYFGFVAKHVAKAAGHADDLSPEQLVLAIVGLTASVILITYVSRVSKRALEQVQRSEDAA